MLPDERFVYCSFFRYLKPSAHLNAWALESLRHALLEQLSQLTVLGRIYISGEGVNAQCVVPESQYKAMQNVIERVADGAFAGVTFFPGNETIDAATSDLPFKTYVCVCCLSRAHSHRS
mgnify:CR=1 FL=1